MFSQLLYCIVILMSRDYFFGENLDEKPEYMIVPLSRSYAEFSKEWWDNQEKPIHAQQIAEIGITSFLINFFESGLKCPSFGGTMVVSKDENIIADIFLSCR